MIYVNRVELKGNVGGNIRSITASDGNKGIQFSVATNIFRKSDSSESGYDTDTTWHSVVVWAGKHIPEFSNIKAGSRVHVVGRLKNKSYTDSNGNQRYYTEIVAQELDLIVPDNLKAQGATTSTRFEDDMPAF